MSSPFVSQSSFRIFAFSIICTLIILAVVGAGLGPKAFALTLILAVLELTFSFDNAIINAKILGTLARPWQMLFLTLGVLVAIFGMRILFPIIIVSATAHLGWSQVFNLALHHPNQYARELEHAHTAIASFGGAFLLMLSLSFFFDGGKRVHWIRSIEKRMQQFSHWAVVPLVVLGCLFAVSALPANSQSQETITAGLLGALTYAFVRAIEGLIDNLQGRQAGALQKTGMAALASLVYLEILDASFSFDGVIGAFAVTSDVILIAAGLGIGALWVRSMTIFMVRRHTLSRYVYIEHGAHYTILVLAVVLLASVAWDISNFVPGLVGLGIIGSSVLASVQERRRQGTARA